MALPTVTDKEPFHTVNSFVTLTNFTSIDIETTVVTDVDASEFKKSPLETLNGLTINKQTSITRPIDMNSFAKKCPWTLELFFTDATRDKFRINQKYATGDGDLELITIIETHHVTFEQQGGQTLYISVKK